MKQWLAFLVCAAFLVLGPTDNASATSGGNNTVAGASAWCFGLESSGSGAIVQPLVECFTDASSGIIPSVTAQFLNSAQKDYVGTIGVIFVLAIVIFGIRLYTGQIERLKGETIIFGLKMAGIMLFLGNAVPFYQDLIAIMQQMANAVASVATSMHTSGFCATNINYSGGANQSAWQNGLWSSWDCIFKFLLGLTSAGFAVSSIAAFLLMLLFSMSAGFIVFFTGLFLILQLLKAAFRFIHVYLMSFLALSFVYCLGYLLVPLLLFKNTFKYFSKWLSMLFGYVLTPVLMFAFMGMMLVALDISIFSGQYSVYCKIGGSSYCGTNVGVASGSGGGYNLFKDITGNIIPANTSMLVSGNPYLQDNFIGPGGFSFNGAAGLYSNQASGYQVIYTNSVATGVAGVQGQMVDALGNPISGSTYDTNKPPEVQNNGIDLVRLNMTTLASGAGSTCNAASLGASGGLFGSGSGMVNLSYYSNCPWLEGVLVSLCVAALITYIMGNLLVFIPRLASSITADLNSSVTNEAWGSMQSKVIGEDSLGKGFNMLKSKAMNYARSTDSSLVGGRDK